MVTIASFNKRLEALRSERSSFIPLWGELSDYHLAHRGRFLLSDRNKGHKRNTKQYNNTSRLAARTLASGMMAGITSPARPWFRLGAPDPDLNEYAPVKLWLHEVQSIMYRVFSHSNTYNALHTLYAELGVFGTSPMGVYKDFNNVIRCKPYTVGSYMLASNGFNVIDTMYREYEDSVAAVVKQFGYDNCSKKIKDQWDRGNTETWVKLVHAVEPNDDRDRQSPLAKDKAWRSVYYEADRQTGDNHYLRQSGFDGFPVLAPRWDITGEDVYGTDCPGMTALGDTKALQLGEKRKYQAIDKIANPPLKGSTNLKKNVRNGGLQGGDIVWGDFGGNDTIESVYGQYRPDINAIRQENMEAEQRIKRAFYEDLFLMISQSDRRQITAREVAEKQEEKLLMLGPVLERLHAELLDPLIDRTFEILQDAGVLPPPPQEMMNREIRVEYISILAQAQRMVAVTGIERLAGFAGQLSTVWPEARHKLNPAEALDEYAESMGTSPRIIRSDDEVQQMVAAEQQAIQQQAQAEQMQQAAQTAKTASETDMQGDNALSNLLRNQGLA